MKSGAQRPEQNFYRFGAMGIFSQNVLKLAAEGATRTMIASQLGIGEATVYRILATDRDRKP